VSDDVIPSFVSVDGLRTYIERSGFGGPPVVLVHTAGMQATEWRYTLPNLAEAGFRGLALDLPGHGKSDPAADRSFNTIHAYAEFVWSLINTLGLDRPIVAGCSIGGCIALDIAAHHDNEISGAITLAATAHNRSVSRQLIQMAQEDSGSPSWPDRAALSARQATGSCAPPERVAEIERAHRASDPKIMAADLEAWNAHDVRGQLAGVRCPLVAFLGGRDYFIPAASASHLRDAIGAGNVYEPQDVGHFPMVEWVGFGDWLVTQVRQMTDQRVSTIP
jgi:pimeloyl-ACP methyl ester carboxylesterase